MSDDGDRTCPLCAEDMDLTDQQLNPCKCGYEMCVWCWHHIIEMAEKEGLEGRCPACRTPYDKQRIVGMAANCKQVVAVISAEKKHKSQKMRNKTSTIEDRKHLSSVRVVQRNLVYIMGVPSSLADESILERKEYFGQYGKILKVSFSRQAGTTQQVSCNDTSSVYITYSREEEAVRCIQAVHNFILEGKPLRACFGTTKYCYTWLRNMICSNPDCLYLHDIGSQEDSFTKDETISAYTRSRVPQISSNNLHPRAGNILPPPADDLFNSVTVSTKQAIKNATNNTASQIRSSSDTCGTRFAGLPAAASWGLRASSVACSQSSSRHKTGDSNISSSSSTLSRTKQISPWNDETITTLKVSEGTQMGNKDGRSRPCEPLKKHCSAREYLTEVPDEDYASSSAWDDDTTTSVISKGGQKEPERPGGRGFTASVSDTSEELDAQESRPSAWDDDLVTTPKVSEEKQNVFVDRFESWDTLEPGTGPSQAHASDSSSNVVTEAACTSGFSISFSCSLATLPESNGGATVSTHQLNSRGLKESDIQPNRFGPADLTHVSTAVNKTVDNLSLGLSTVNLENNPGLGHMITGKHQNSSADNHLASLLGSFSSRLDKVDSGTGSELSSSQQRSGPSISDAHVSADLADLRLKMQKQDLSSVRNAMEDTVAANDDQRERLSRSNNPTSCLSQSNGRNGPSISDAHVSADLSDLRLKMQKQDLSFVRNAMEDTLAATDDQRQRLSRSNNPTSCLSQSNGRSGPSMSDAHVSADLLDLRLKMQKQDLSSVRNAMEDTLAATGDQRQRLSPCNNPTSCLSQSNDFLNMSNQLTNSSQNGGSSDKWFLSERNNGTIGTEIVEGSSLFRENESLFINGHKEEHLNNYANSERVSNYVGMSHSFNESTQSRGFDNITSIEKSASVDKGDGNIVSDEFDPWDDSWSSANNFAKLLGQMNRHEGVSKHSNSWKTHKNNESRFSFARQENQANLGDSSCSEINHARRFNFAVHGSYGNPLIDTFPINTFEGTNSIGSNNSVISSDRFAGVSRANISATPFSVSKIAPPPGFSSHDRYDQAFNTCSERFPFSGSNHNQVQQAYSAGNAGDVEFIDPAILAVGKGRLPLGVNNTGLGLGSAFPPQFCTSESDRRIHLLQQAISANQDLRISNNVADRFSQYNDPYHSSRFSSHSPSSVTPFAQISHQSPSRTLNGQWDGWNGLPMGNNMGIADVLRNQVFGLNHYVPVSEEPKFHVPSQGDLYSRAFGM